VHAPHARRRQKLMVDFVIFKNLTFFSTIAKINFTGNKSNHSDIDGGKEKGIKVTMATTKKIFLASSSELEDDRKEFEIFINRKNKGLRKKGFFIELVIWEDFLDAMSQTRLQDEYNKAVKECDIFVMLFFTKVGKYTEEEFEIAFGQFKAANKPLIYTYFKDAQITTGSLDEQDTMSLFAFKKKLW
jgi:hypothetical protein